MNPAIPASADSLLNREAPTWDMRNLQPNPADVLIDGKAVPFSVDLAFLSTEGTAVEYEAAPAFNNCRQRPFKLTLTSDSIEFHGKATWYQAPNARTQLVDFELFEVKASQDGRYTQRTLLKQISAVYSVKCNPHQWGVKRAVRRWLGYCN